MKRSRVVQAFLVVSAATALNGCGQKHEASRRCVDENGAFSEDRNCSSAAIGGGAHHYTWVYAPVGASNATSEATSPAKSTTGAAGSSSESTSRGVVGAAGASHSGGEGGHGGGGGE